MLRVRMSQVERAGKRCHAQLMLLERGFDLVYDVRRNLGGKGRKARAGEIELYLRQLMVGDRFENFMDGGPGKRFGKDSKFHFAMGECAELRLENKAFVERALQVSVRAICQSIGWVFIVRCGLRCNRMAV